MADTTTPAPATGTTSTPAIPANPAASAPPTVPTAPTAAPTITDVLNTSDATWRELLGMKDAELAAQAPAREEPPADAAPAPAAAPDAPAAPPEATGTYTLDEQNRLHRPDGTFAEADEIAAFNEVMAEQGSATKAEAPAPDQPTVGTVTPQGFQVTDHEGKPLASIPDLRLTFTANGKVRENVPLEKLVRQAQNFTYSQELQEEAIQARQTIPQLQQQVEHTAQQFEALTSQVKRLLEDDEFFLSAREAYAQANRPEVRLQQLEAENRALRDGTTTRQTTEQARSYVATEIAPALQTLAQQYPSVPFPELFGQFSLLTAPLLQSGVIPVQRLPDVQRMVTVDLAHWAQTLHDQRTETVQQTTTQQQKRIEAERIKAAMAKRQLARVVAPKGGQAPAIRETPPPKTYKSTDDVLNDIDAIVRQTLNAA